MALDNRGSVAVIVAFFLTVFITILGFVVNEGWLFANKNIFQNAAEAGAMAGAARLCEGDAVSVARQIAIENGAPQDGITVEVGFYDEADAYEDFPQYTNFIADPDPDTPENENLALGDDQYEYDNAVLVRIERDEPVILGGFLGRDQARVVGLAVGYLRRYDLVSLNEGGEIRIRGHYSNGIVWGNGDVKYADESLTVFDNVDLFAHGEVLACPVTSSWWGGTTIHWESGSPSDLDSAYPGAPEITEIRQISDDYIEWWRQRADQIYTPNSPEVSGGGSCAATGTIWKQHCYYIDLSGDNGGNIYFFDAQGQEDVLVSIQPSCSNCERTASNFIFVANCDVQVNPGSSWSGHNHLHLGGRGEEQVIIITSGNIYVPYGDLWLEGVVFRCGGDFIMPPSHGDVTWQQAMITFRNRFRAIADGDIDINSTSNYDFGFGPPCPPCIVKLGRP